MNATTTPLPAPYWTFKRLGAAAIAFLATILIVVALTLAASGHSTIGRAVPAGTVSRPVNLPERDQLRW